MEDAGRILPQSLQRDCGSFTHTLTSDFWPPALGRNKFLLLSATKFVAICHGSQRSSSTPTSLPCPGLHPLPVSHPVANPRHVLQVASTGFVPSAPHPRFHLRSWPS